jgi:hypothetical protein
MFSGDDIGYKVRQTFVEAFDFEGRNNFSSSKFAAFCYRCKVMA